MITSNSVIRQALRVARRPSSWLAALSGILFADPFYDSILGAKPISMGISEAAANVSAFVGNPLVRFLMLPLMVLCFWRAGQAVAAEDKKQNQLRKEVSDEYEEVIKQYCDQLLKTSSFPNKAIYLEIMDREVGNLLAQIAGMEGYLKGRYAYEVNTFLSESQVVVDRHHGRPPKLDVAMSQVYGCAVLGIPQWNPAWDFQEPILLYEESQVPNVPGRDIFRKSSNQPFVQSLEHNRKVFQRRIDELKAYADRRTSEIAEQRRDLHREIVKYWQKSIANESTST